MNGKAQCERCGTPLTMVGERNLCPACLLQLALEAPSSTTDASATVSAGFEADFTEDIGPYRILSRLGEGGMGIVYLAEQEHPLRRRVAVKIIKLGMDTRRIVARFEAERQTLALMEHPNIATVFDAGATRDGRPYFAMEYVPGLPLTDYCDRNQLSVRTRLELLVQVCDAIQHAHQKGTIHRDLKPRNVLVTIVNGRPVPKVIDFGIAKATRQNATEQSWFTEHGVLIGTPEYMSPEQAEWNAVNIDTRTDIYSLGILLYELLVGAVPFNRARLCRAGFAEIQRIIREEEPIRPSTHLSSPGIPAEEVAQQRKTDAATLARALRGDLDWIALKALEKDRTRRYPSASEFGADISRYLDNEPVVARPPSVRYRALKFVRRHRWPAIATLALLTSVIGGLGATTWLYGQAEHARREADSHRKSAERHRDEALLKAYTSNIQLAWLNIKGGRIREAKRQLELCDPRFRGWEWQYLTLAADASMGSFHLPTRAGNTPPSRDNYSLVPRVDWLAVDPTRNQLTALQVEPGNANGIVLFGSPTDGGTVERLEPSTIIIALNPGGTRAAVLHWQMYNSSKGVTVHLNGDHSYSVRAIDEVGEKKRTQLTIVDTKSRAVISQLRLPNMGVWRSTTPLTGPPNFFRRRDNAALYDPHRLAVVSSVSFPRAVSAAMNADGTEVAAWSWDNVIHVWNTLSGKARAQLRGHTDLVTAAEFSNDGTLISGSHDGTVRVWDIAEGVQIRTLIGGSQRVTAIARDASGAVVAAGRENGSIVIWRSANVTGLPLLDMHTGEVTSLAFSPDGTLLASTSLDRTVRVWDLSTTQAIRVFRDHDVEFRSVTFNPGGRMIASGGTGSTIRIWDLQQRPTEVVLSTTAQNALGFGADERTLLTRDGDRLNALELDSGKVLATLQLPRGGHRAALSLNGDRIAVGGDGHLTPSEQVAPVSVGVFDASMRKVIAELRCPHTLVASLAFDSSGRFLASAAMTPEMIGSETLHVWDTQTGRLLAEARLERLSPRVVAFSPDAKTIAMDSDSGVTLWDWERGKTTIVVSQIASAVQYLSDGTLALGAEKTLELRDGRTGATVGELVGHDGRISAVAADPAATRIFTAGDDGTLRVWDAATRALLLTLPAPNRIRSLLVSRDGRTIAAIGKGIHVWHAAVPSKEDPVKEFFAARR